MLEIDCYSAGQQTVTTAVPAFVWGLVGLIKRSLQE